MKICINSRDLTPAQKRRIEEYFLDNFSFENRKPTLIWKQDDSDFVLLGYPRGNLLEFDAPTSNRDPRSFMFRVHEAELMEIAGRDHWREFREASELWSVSARSGDC